MATMRLTDGTNTVDFDPGEGYTIPDDFEESVLRALDGTEYRYRFYKKKRWEIPLKYVPKADAEIINGWREDNEDLSFYPDLEDSPETFYTVRIQNTTRPLSKMAGKVFDTYYEGTLILQEI